MASWHPELIPTLVVREAYGTRARDTDWLDGFYPYHEMDAYLGLIAMAWRSSVPEGQRPRDRWTSFWVLLIGLGAILMLGRFTFLFDQANHIPVLGSSREPVRFSLWVSMGVAALAAVGVDRLGRPGAVSTPRRVDPGRRAGPVIDPDHDLYLSPCLDAAQALDRCVSPRPLSLARTRARQGDDSDGSSGRVGLVGCTKRHAGDHTVAPRAVGGPAPTPGPHRSSRLPLARRTHDRAGILDQGTRVGATPEIRLRLDPHLRDCQQAFG